MRLRLRFAAVAPFWTGKEPPETKRAVATSVAGEGEILSADKAKDITAAETPNIPPKRKGEDGTTAVDTAAADRRGGVVRDKTGEACEHNSYLFRGNEEILLGGDLDATVEVESPRVQHLIPGWTERLESDYVASLLLGNTTDRTASTSKGVKGQVSAARWALSERS